MKFKLAFLGIFSSVLLILFRPESILAIVCDLNNPSLPEASLLSEYEAQCLKDRDENVQKKQTLQAAINILNFNIRIAETKIKQTSTQIVSLEKDIDTLSAVVSDLNNSLNNLTNVFLARVRASYMRRDPNALTLLISSDSFAKFFTRIRYLSVVKARDQLIISEMNTARKDYDTQKNTKITKQKEIEELKKKLVRQQSDLSAQRRSQQEFLNITENKEVKYQELLGRIRSELEAINAIIAGNGNEKEVRDVSQGEVIANVINQPSCNSSGAHLHFIISDNSITKNPFDYLKPIDNFNCSGVNGGGCFDGDPFNPTGSWDWPLSPRIQLNQGYGETWAVRNTWVGNIYRFHNGIDIEGGSLEVKAVQSGKLFRGTYSGSNGCALKYVRVDHKDSDIDTFYLHVNYN